MKAKAKANPPMERASPSQPLRALTKNPAAIAGKVNQLGILCHRASVTMAISETDATKKLTSQSTDCNLLALISQAAAFQA
jgi:hypothetical protein